MSDIVEMPAFNANIAVTDLLMKTLENASRDLACRCVAECATRYGFDANEAIKEIGLESLALIRKQMAKKSSGTKAKAKAPKAKAPKEKKEPDFPLPFCEELVNPEFCNGLAYNRGLFTQCPKKHMEGGLYCKGCQAEADSNACGIPTCGTVSQRLATGLYEFKDTKGRSPVSYAKLLAKLKLSEDSALEVAGKLNIGIDEAHFVVQEKPKKSSTGSRGRPKKESVNINANGTVDLFNQMRDEATVTSAEEVNISKKAKLTEEEKEEKRKQLEAQKEEKKKEREVATAQKKEHKETAKKMASEGNTLDELVNSGIPEDIAKEAVAEAYVKAQAKAAKEVKIAQEKAEREAKRLAEKEKKTEERKKAKEEAAELKKSLKSKLTVTPPVSAPVSKPASAPESPKSESESEAETPKPAQKAKCTRIRINGVDYLKTSENVLYNPVTKEPVGTWDSATKKILPYEEEEEEEEEEYEEDA